MKNQSQSYGYGSTELNTFENRDSKTCLLHLGTRYSTLLMEPPAKKGLHATSLNGLHMTREQRLFLVIRTPQLSGNIAPHRKAVELVRRNAFFFGRLFGLVGQPDTREGIQGSIRPVARDPLQVVEGRVYHDAAALQRRQNVVTLLQYGQHGIRSVKI